MRDEDTLLRESERIAQLLDHARAMAGPQTWAIIDELIQRTVGLYGSGLASLVAIARATAESDDAVCDAITADALLSSLLIIHDVHPLPLAARIERAIADGCARTGQRPTDIEVAGIDAVEGVTLRVAPRAAPAQAAITRAIEALAPEVTAVHIEAAPRLYAIRRRS